MSQRHSYGGARQKIRLSRNPTDTVREETQHVRAKRRRNRSRSRRRVICAVSNDFSAANVSDEEPPWSPTQAPELMKDNNILPMGIKMGIHDTPNEVGYPDLSAITYLDKLSNTHPFEHRLWKLVCLGIDNGIPLECVVAASTLSADCNIFYRGGTDAEKGESDKCKTRFCLKSGDFTTTFEVFRKWDAQPKGRRGHWCFQNSVNGKSIKAIDEIATSAISVLRELNISVTRAFTVHVPVMLTRLSSILLDCFKGNIAVYSGNERVGYFVFRLDEYVPLHPSSSFRSLAFFPEWIIFGQIVQLPIKFLKTISSVKRSELVQLQDSIDFDLDEAELKVLQTSVVGGFGPRGLHHLNGTKGCNLQATKDKIRKKTSGTSDDVVRFEMLETKGSVEIVSSRSLHASAVSEIYEMLGRYRSTLEQEVEEVLVGTPRSEARLLLKNGCFVSEVLVGKDFCAVQVTFNRRLNRKIVMDSLANSAVTVKEVINENSENVNALEVKFSSSKDALNGRNVLNQINGVVAVPTKASRVDVDQGDEVILRFQWLRRPCKGVGFVVVDSKASKADLLRMNSSISITHKNQCFNIFFKQPRNPKGLDSELKVFVTGLGADVDAEDITKDLNSYFKNHGQSIIVKYLIVVRHIAETTSLDEFEEKKEALKCKLKNVLGHSNFDLWLDQPRESHNVWQSVKVTVLNLRTARVLANSCELKQFTVPGTFGPLQIQPTVGTSILLSRTLVLLARDHLDNFRKDWKYQHQGEITLRERRARGDIVLEFSGCTLDQVEECQLVVRSLVSNCEIPLDSLDARVLFCSFEGNRLLEKIGKELGVHAVAVPLKNKITVHGTQNNCSTAKYEILRLIEDIPVLKTVNLKAAHWPRGFMRHLMLTYRHDLAGLLSVSGAKTLTLDHVTHTIMLQGDDEAIEKMEDLLQQESRTLMKTSRVVEADKEECPVCLTELFAQLYRLELCGHAYHVECIRNFLNNAIRSKEFPIVCCEEMCNCPLALPDLHELCTDDQTWSSLMESALADYVARNPDVLRFCSTPDCTAVYKVTTEAADFACLECYQHWCTHCHSKFHPSQSCKEVKDCKDILRWMREDPRNRKQCPKCKSGIEKTEGCQRMHCTMCKVNMCWRCLETFPTENATYDHLTVGCAGAKGIFDGALVTDPEHLNEPNDNGRVAPLDGELGAVGEGNRAFRDRIAQQMRTDEELARALFEQQLEEDDMRMHEGIPVLQQRPQANPQMQHLYQGAHMRENDYAAEVVRRERARRARERREEALRQREEAERVRAEAQRAHEEAVQRAREEAVQRAREEAERERRQAKARAARLERVRRVREEAEARRLQQVAEQAARDLAAQQALEEAVRRANRIAAQRAQYTFNRRANENREARHSEDTRGGCFSCCTVM